MFKFGKKKETVEGTEGLVNETAPVKTPWSLKKKLAVGAAAVLGIGVGAFLLTRKGKDADAETEVEDFDDDDSCTDEGEVADVPETTEEVPTTTEF